MPALLQQIPDQRSRVAGTTIPSILISFYICTWIVIGSFFLSPQFLHWFIIPVLLCGTLIGIDAVDWFRNRLDIFDPRGIIGLFGLHFFFLAPLLHVYWDYWLEYVTPPLDWRNWLGAMAVLNFFGLLLYRFSADRIMGAAQELLENRFKVWSLDRARFLTFVTAALIVTAALQVWVYISEGGIIGYIQSYEDINQLDSFRGMGWIFTISESFPILAMMAFAVLAQNKKQFQSWTVLLLTLIVYFILVIFFGGLRGSRSNTIWSLFWALGIIHFWIRPVSKKIIAVGLVFLLLFMYFYGFYKSAGLDGLAALGSSDARTELSGETGRDFRTAILGDLGRSDIQAFLLYRMVAPDRDYQYAWGRTYLGALAQLIPASIWPDRIPTKVKEGTEAQFGMGTFDPVTWKSGNVYGLAGETMLNFGPVLVPFSFLILGLAVSAVRRFMINADRSDIRLLLLPFLVNLCFVLMVSDSDNDIFFLIKDGSIPFLVVLLGSSVFRLAKDPVQRNLAI